MQNRLAPGAGVTPSQIRNDMRAAGYTDIATTLSLESLQRKALIECGEEPFGERADTYYVFTLTERGLDWMLENRDRFKLSREHHSEGPTIADEDIPF